MRATILDACCGSKMFWFDKYNPQVMYMDCREESHILCDGRVLEIEPDVVGDFRAIPFDDEDFHMVIFDPPHLLRAGESSWLKAKYGKLSSDWSNDLRQGFAECFRVLKPYGTLIFKWNECQIPLKDILALTDEKPLVGNQRGKTHWLVFMKQPTT